MASSDGNILIAGGTGSGKTTLLNAVVGLLPREDRIVVIEDTMEIRCNHPNCVRLEARGASGGGVAVRDLVKHTLRHRPDHIVIGEVRGAEAGDVLQALNTGHGGSMTTIHASTCESALSRMANCAMQAGDGLPWDVTCGNVAQAFSMVVRQARVGGVRGVREVLYVDGYDAVERRWVLREAWRSPRAAELGTDGPGWRPVEGLRGVKAGPREEVTVASLLLALGGSSAGKKLWSGRRRRAMGKGSRGLAASPGGPSATGGRRRERRRDGRGRGGHGGSAMSGKSPRAEVRLGRIMATIWANRGQDGGRWHTVQITRLYQEGGQWRWTHSFGRNDLLAVAKVADLAHSKVCELDASERDRERAPAEESEA